MNRHEWFDRAVSVLVLLVALGSFGVLIRKHIDEPQVSGITNERSAKRIVKWAEISSEDSLVVEYSEKNQHGLTLQLIHLPLDMHLNAVPAAHAFECALAQGKAHAFARSLYERQSSLGEGIWDSLATSAGVPSLSDFQTCMRAPIPASVEAGKRLARELGVSITPTVVINDWLITPADPEYVFEAIKAVAEGRSPSQ